jgi:hypothetical protein
VLARPAQPTQLGTGDPFALLGTALVGGSATLLLRPGAATTPLVADAAWLLAITDQGATAAAQATASGTPVPPGLYAASIQVARTLTLPGGGVRVITQVSNEVPMMIAPGVSALGAPDATGEFTITGIGFTPATAVALYLGTERAVSGNPVLLAPGEFAVLSATSLVARLSAGIMTGTAVPVRVIVSGSEAPPHWVIAP